MSSMSVTAIKLFTQWQRGRSCSSSQGIHVLDEDNSNMCECRGYRCGCCARLVFDAINLHHTVCANHTYLPVSNGLSLTLTLDEKTITNETVSARNPPSSCVGIPDFKKHASLCVWYYNLKFSSDAFSGCVCIDVRLETLIEGQFRIGCFKITPGNETVSPGY